jgi:hypothetical protein
VFLRVYAAKEPIEPEGPTGWTLAGAPFHSDLVFDWLQIHITSGTRQTLDEVRLGTTWPSVTAPWRGAGGAGPEPGGRPAHRAQGRGGGR